MKIVKLQIKNFLSIADAEIVPGAVNQIVGSNNQGKTTVLRAIETALKGSTDGTLVKRGEDSAEIILEFDNDVSIRRKIRADGKQEVTVKKGEFKADSPQSMLNGLLFSGAFNPLDLLDVDRREKALLTAIQVRIDEAKLKEFAGDAPVPLPPLDYDQHGLKVLEQAHKYFYQRRAEANRDAKAKSEIFRVKKAEFVETLPEPTEFSDPDQDLEKQVLELRNALSEEHQKGALATDRKRRVREEQDKLVTMERNIQKACEAVAVLQGKIESARQDYSAQLVLIGTLQTEAAAVEPNQSRIEALHRDVQARLRELNRREKTKAEVARRETLKRFELETYWAEKFAAQLDDTTNRLAKAQNWLMESVELPVKGLTYQDGEFFLDGDSIDNLSSSKALKLAVALARKLAGPMKLICLDGAELLDQENYEALRREIEGDGFTYFVTKVGDAFPHGGDRVVRMQAGEAVLQ